jgi:CubicO group peptidase (beta-lactamase class C family)
MTKPESLGLCSTRLARIDRFLAEEYVEPGKLPCAMVLVARGGALAHLSVQGFADVERRQKLHDDTIFRIYSMTKPVTSVAFMMLVEEGKVALDDPVAKCIPSWEGLGVYQSGINGAYKTSRPVRPMQMVDLLRHTSGLTYGFQHRSNVDAAYRAKRIGEVEKAGTMQSMIDGLAKIPLEFSPGTAWNYSVSTDVLAYLVETISGQKFEDFLAERIFAPLGMTDTGFHVPEASRDRLASCYAAAPGGGLVLQDDAQGSSFLAPPSFVSGGGGLVSTMSDYLRFSSMLLQGGELGEARLLGRKTLELMTSNHLPGGKYLADMSVSLFSEAAYDGVGFGLGFSVTMDPARTLLAGSAGDFGWGGAASTYFWVDPQEELIVILMTQLLPSTTYPIRRQLRTLVYSALT